jgi:hypothetical protein
VPFSAGHLPLRFTLPVPLLDQVIYLRPARDPGLTDIHPSHEDQVDVIPNSHDPTESVGRLLSTSWEWVAEFEADLIRARTREGMTVAIAKGRLKEASNQNYPRRSGRTF